MCSIGEDDFGDEGGVHAMTPKQVNESMVDNFSRTGICKRCGASDVMIYKVYLRDLECRDCFLSHTRHKFRATLGSSKVLPRDANVLLIFNRNPEAMVLLDMLHHAQTQNAFKRLHCKAKILCIVNTDEKSQTISSFQEHLNKYECFTSYIMSISNKHIKPLKCIDIEKFLKSNCDSDEEWLKHIDSIRTLTSRQEFIRQYKNRLISFAAKYLECPFVFLPDINHNLSTQLLTSIILGRGGNAAMDVSLLDDRHGVKFVRPLRDLHQPEVELYLKVQNLVSLNSDQENITGLEEGPMSSLQNLTKAFVDNLQENFPATVSTVFRTGEKITSNRELIEPVKDGNLKNNNEQKTMCSACNSYLDCPQSTSLLAIEFSKVVSKSTEVSLNDYNGLDITARKHLDDILMKKHLCYACRSIENDSSFNDLFSKFEL